MPVPIPHPCILDDLIPVSGRKRLFEWDGLHGEVEVYNARGRHLGVVDPITGLQTKPAVRGRRIDV